MLLRITDGVSTVTLHDDDSSPSAGLLGCIYFPTDPGNAESVTETADVAFSGATATVIETINDLERLLSSAVERPVFAEYSRDGNGVHTSPILGGRVQWNSERERRQIYGTTTAGSLSIIFERAPFWEGTEATYGTGNIVNGNSSPYNALSLTDLTGNLPTPLKISLYNNNGVEVDARKFYLTVDNYGDLTSNQHLGNGSLQSWTPSVSHNNLLWIFSLSTDFLSGLSGRNINVLAVFDSIPSGVYVRASLYSVRDGLYVGLQHGNEQYVVSEKLFNLGAFSLPDLATTGLAIAISIYSTSPGSATLNFAQLTPSENMVSMDLQGYGWKNGEYVTDDYGFTYVLSGSDKYTLLHRSGGPLMAWPGRDNRVFIIFDEGTSFDDTRTATVTIDARPRRSTV